MQFQLLIVVLFLIAIYLLIFGFRVVRQWLEDPDDTKDGKRRR